MIAFNGAQNSFNSTVAAVQKTVSAAPPVAVGSPASPITQSTLPQAHRIHSCLSRGAIPGSPRHEANYSASQGQNVQATPQDVESIHRRIFSTPRTFIPPLFYAMGNYIPKLMVDLAVSPQARWSEHGEFEEVTHRMLAFIRIWCIFSQKRQNLNSILRTLSRSR